MPEGDPELILEDLDFDGVDVGVMHPNLSLFGLYSDDHELSMAHARVYNDYIVERFSPYFSRLAPTAPIPLTDVEEAVAEIERVAAGGFRAILLPATPPKPYYSRDFDPMWAAAQANGVHVFIHTQTGGVKVNDPESTTLKVVMENGGQVNQPMTEKSAAKRMITQCIYSTHRPAAGHLRADRRRRRRALPRSALRADRVQRPLAGLTGRSHGQVLDHGHRAGRGLVARLLGRERARRRSARHGPAFRLNEKWPYPLKPSEYVQRQFHVSFQDDPVAVACRHITGLSTIVWGNDYPHAEGTFRGSRAADRRAVRRCPRRPSGTP